MDKGDMVKNQVNKASFLTSIDEKHFVNKSMDFKFIKKQEREGRLRELKNLSDLDNLDLENEILETLKHGNRREKELLSK